jgi:hypothetical protein
VKKILTFLSIMMVLLSALSFNSKSPQIGDEDFYLDFDEAGLPVHVEI